MDEHSETDALPLPGNDISPGEFDQTLALAAAMRVFWENGFEGSSYQDLAAAMNISVPAANAIYGTKEDLYTKSVRLFVTVSGEFFDRTLQEFTDVREAFNVLIERAALEFDRTDRPQETIASVYGVDVIAGHPNVEDYNRCARDHVRSILLKRLNQAVDDGQLAEPADAERLALYFVAVLRGMAGLARDGSPQSALKAIAVTTMLVWSTDPVLKARRPSRRPLKKRRASLAKRASR